MKSKTIVVIVILIILLIALITALGKAFGDTKKSILEYLLEAFIVVLVIIIFIALGMKFIYGVDISSQFNNSSGKNELDIIFNQTTQDKNKGASNNIIENENDGGDIVPEIKIKKQVFNIPDNTYNYTDAIALCKAYGGNLANYKQIEDAYRNGGEWCSYGWSDGQMALFPTQKDTWKELQSIPGHENDCGRPGVNGGYIGNPGAQFGVNCYGYKPEITDNEKQLLQRGFVPPMTPRDKVIKEKEQYYKQKLSTIMVSPFNYSSWSHLF